MLADDRFISMAGFCRRRDHDLRLPEPVIPRVNAELAGNLGHTTNNLDQIARHLNNGQIGDSEDLELALKDLVTLVNQLRTELVGLRPFR